MQSKFIFIHEYLEEKYTMSELCRQHGISRKTGYKLIERYKQESYEGLYKTRRKEINHPRKTSQEVSTFIIEIKEKYKTWGPKKIKQWLEREYSDQSWPAASTIGDLLKKEGLTGRAPRKRSKVAPYTEPFKSCESPNAVWSADFKGNFTLGNKSQCYPLTVTDNYSRCILLCDSLGSPNLAGVKAGLIRALRTYGLPDAIRTDNGSPFASTGVAGLSKLSIWLIKQGITPERIQQGHPEQNGRHERMHRTLKAEATKPPGKTLEDQQVIFDEFVEIYNHVRPHAALLGKSPGELYKPSERKYKEGIIKAEYDTDMIVRRVKPSGCIRVINGEFYLGSVLAGEDVGFKEVDNGYWIVYLCHMPIAMINGQEKRIERP